MDAKTTVRQFIDRVWNDHDLNAVTQLLAADYDFRDPNLPHVHGPAAMREFLASYLTAFPDVRFVVDSMVAEGDTVATRWRAMGHNTGPFQGNPPTNRALEVAGCQFDRVKDGKIVEARVIVDTAGMMKQLGRAPVLEAAK